MANTINCPVCGKLTDSRLDSCPHCGAYLKSRRQQARSQQEAARASKSCPRCGSSVQEGDIICVSCGTNLLTGQKIADEARQRTRRAIPWGWIGGIAAAVVVVAGVAGLWIYAAARDPLSQAQRLAADGNFLEAQNLLEPYVERVPDDLPALLELGRVQWLGSQYSKAAATFSRASRLDPNNEDAAVWAAVAAARNASEPTAEFLGVLGRAAELKRDDAGLWYTLALARGVSGDYDGEIEALNRVVGLQPTDDNAHLNLGVAYALNGDAASARNELQSVGDGPLKSSALASLGFVGAMQGDDDQATRRLSEALAAGGTVLEVEAQLALGRASLEQGDFQDAQSRFEQTLAADSRNRQARYLRGLCLQARGRYEDALADFVQLTTEPGAFAAEAGVQAAAIQLTLNAPDRARRALDDASRAGANNAAYHTVAGRLALASEDPEGAMSAFNNAVRSDSRYAAAYLERGLLHIQRDETVDGLADLDNYLQLVGDQGRGTRMNEVRALADQLRQAVQGPGGGSKEASF